MATKTVRRVVKIDISRLASYPAGRMSRTILRKFWPIVGLMLGTGCSSTLETGYKPRYLGDSDVQRRAYYSSPFTTQAKAAEQEQQYNQTHRPKPGY